MPLGILEAILDSTGVFIELKKIMQPYERFLECKVDTDTEYHLDTKHIMNNNKPLFFGAVTVKKNYVSYHLMPVYVETTLLSGLTEKLKKHMHGKSCFNFKVLESDMLIELKSLTDIGFNYYRENNLLG